MSHVVFAQRADATLDLAHIAQLAERHFGAKIDEIPVGAAAAAGPIRLRLVDARRGLDARFRLSARRATPADWQAARSAEERGRAAGMAALAARCPTLWQVEPSAEADDAATLLLCAVLAFGALGPVMPEDGSTLFGVRGALERVERALGGRTLLR